MQPSFINIVGLCFDISGVVLLFFFGLPPKVVRGGTVYRVVSYIDEKEKAKAARYDAISRGALILILCGFLLQGVSSFLSLRVAPHTPEVAPAAATNVGR